MLCFFSNLGSIALAAWLFAFGLGTAVFTVPGQTGRWGDQGDGTFRNPVIAADYSDADPLRVGEDYYLVASTFESSPGVTILHSKDLVNWRTLGGVFPDLTRLGGAFSWNRMERYGQGIYAPSLRYHAGKFWVFVNCVTPEGFWCATATDPAGPWEIHQLVDKNGAGLRVSGWTDPCPFWDDDGRAYLATSRPGPQWFSYLFEMTPDGRQLLDAEVEHMGQGGIVHAYPRGGTRYSPFFSSEGNKIYKRNGYYYLLHIEFLDGGQGRGTYVFRSRHLYGTQADGSPGRPGQPGTYEVLKYGPVGDGEFGQAIPGQGGLVDTPDGRWFWLAQFNRYASDGRPPHLLPVTWIDDWPVPGYDIEGLQGHFRWQQAKPISGHPVQLPQGSDDFASPTLLPQWIWNHQPRADRWSLTERPGFLRLRAFPRLRSDDFFTTGNIVAQRHYRSEKTTVTARLGLAGMVSAQSAGLAHFTGREHYAFIAVQLEAEGALRVVVENTGRRDTEAPLPAGTRQLWLRSTTGFDEQAVFSYSVDGTTFTPLGGPYRQRSHGFRGNLIGLFTHAARDGGGYVDIDQFDYETRHR
ncbi:MAG: Xylan 1,3-beta-xylosidase [Verrucomicrobiota bacterium]